MRSVTCRGAEFKPQHTQSPPVFTYVAWWDLHPGLTSPLSPLSCSFCLACSFGQLHLLHRVLWHHAIPNTAPPSFHLTSGLMWNMYILSSSTYENCPLWGLKWRGRRDDIHIHCIRSEWTWSCFVLFSACLYMAFHSVVDIAETSKYM